MTILHAPTIIRPYPSIEKLMVPESRCLRSERWSISGIMVMRMTEKSKFHVRIYGPGDSLGEKMAKAQKSSNSIDSHQCCPSCPWRLGQCGRWQWPRGRVLLQDACVVSQIPPRLGEDRTVTAVMVPAKLLGSNMRAVIVVTR